MGRTGDAAAVAATAEPFVAARATALESVYLDEGLDPAEAALLGREAAEQLTLSNYGNEASFFVTYPEDIDLFGFSFSMSTSRTGTLFAGEITITRFSLSDRLRSVVPDCIFTCPVRPRGGQYTVGRFWSR